MQFWKNIRVAAVVLPAGLMLAQNIDKNKTISKQAEYAKAVETLKGSPRTKKKPPPPMITGDISVPIAISGDRPALLPESAIEAIRLESSWHNSAEPMLDKDGSIAYVYGQGQPNIPCAVERITTIRLAPGETLDASDAAIGDSKRWLIAKHQIMHDGKVQTYVIVKPQYTGLDTTLSIFTNEHAYNLRLLSDIQGIDFVSFSYPQEEAEAQAAEQRKQKQLEAQQEADRKAEEYHQHELRAVNMAGAITNSDYSVHVGKHAEYIRPKLLGDNGALTYIQLDPNLARHRTLPSLQVIGFTGPKMPNVHFDTEQLLFTVEGLFSEAQLVVGGRKHHQLIVTIKNNSKGGA